jgi:hypothetical protein
MKRPPCWTYLDSPSSFKIKAPSFRSRPLRLSGMPMERDTLDLNAEMPNKRRQENPP